MRMNELWSVVSAIFCVLIVVMFAKHRMKKRYSGKGRYQYDERQLAEQGKAGKYAMYTAMIAIFVCGILQDAGLEIGGIFGACCCIAISLTVFAGICIFKDAYFYTSRQPKVYMWYFGALGALLTASGIWRIVSGDVMIDGVLTSGAICLPIGIMCIAIVLFIIIKRGMDRREEQE